MRFGGIVLATAFVLAACSSDPAPREPSDPSPSASAAPTATVPTPVAQVSEDTPEGAAAFVKHYVDVFNYAAATGDVDELSRLSSPDCGGCQSYITLYRDTYAAGGYFKGADWSLGEIQLRILDDQTFATTTASTDPGPYKESGSGPELISTGTDNEVSFAVQRQGTIWQVRQFGLGGVQ